MMSDTRENILTTALELFAKDGYEAVSVSMIAGKLGMTKGALYQQYLAGGPLEYMAGIIGSMKEAMDFYGPFFLMYSLYDGTDDKKGVLDMADEHIDRFIDNIRR